MKKVIVQGLELLCNALDRAPTWEVVNGRRQRFAGGWGCQLGLSGLSANLDERWRTGVWQCPKERAV